MVCEHIWVNNYSLPWVCECLMIQQLTSSRSELILGTVKMGQRFLLKGGWHEWQAVRSIKTLTVAPWPKNTESHGSSWKYECKSSWFIFIAFAEAEWKEHKQGWVYTEEKLHSLIMENSMREFSCVCLKPEFLFQRHCKIRTAKNKDSWKVFKCIFCFGNK